MKVEGLQYSFGEIHIKNNRDVDFTMELRRLSSIEKRKTNEKEGTRQRYLVGLPRKTWYLDFIRSVHKSTFSLQDPQVTGENLLTTRRRRTRWIFLQTTKHQCLITKNRQYD